MHPGYTVGLVCPNDPGALGEARGLVREYLTAWCGGLHPAELREQDAALLIDMAYTKSSPVALARDPAGEAVGVAVLHRFDGQSEMRASYVQPEHRGRGLCRNMTRLLLERAAELGLGEVFTVVAEGQILEAAFRRHGLAPSGPPPDGEPGYVRFDLPLARHTTPATVS